MKDLEIRGAGSILGAEQSGHIAGVGFDLYVRLVSEAVTAFKKQAGAVTDDVVEEETAEVRVELPVDANVPHDYIPSELLRLDAYRKIAAITTEDDISAIRAELTDRFGPLPAAVEALLAVANLRLAAREVGVTEIAMGPNGIRISPLQLPESVQLRLARVYPASKYSKSSATITLRTPTESDRIGAPLLRDNAMLAWVHRVLADLTPARVR